MLLDLVLISIFSLVFAIGLFSHYQPRINQIEKTFNNLNSKLKGKLNNMSETERGEFFNNLSNETREFYNNILEGNMNFDGINGLRDIQEHICNTYSMQDMNGINDLQFQQFTDWAMNESMKAVTPFDHGGYVQGPGFNPSDTMHHQMDQDMNQFHNHDYGMHDNMNSGMDNHFNGF